MGRPNYQQTPANASRLFALSHDLMGALDRVQPRVTVQAAREEERWRFTVEDNGIGIEPRHVDRVFGMFQRLHTRDEFDGSGIGLAIARKVVERHDGEISAALREEDR